ncbi:hypothetical protein HD554DRAFT_235712 [Boletus coccyginus]|nr:hypothetical protein HD554DRAFT_235712 [Boletus coccyginus]
MINLLALTLSSVVFTISRRHSAAPCMLPWAQRNLHRCICSSVWSKPLALRRASASWMRSALRSARPELMVSLRSSFS